MELRIVWSKSGFENWCILIRDANEEKFLKLYRDSSRQRNELAAIALLETHQIAVPKVLASGKRKYLPYICFEGLRSIDILPEDYHIESLVKLLTPIYQIKGSCFGRVSEVLDGGGFKNWVEYLRNRLELYSSVLIKHNLLQSAKEAIDVIDYCLGGPFCVIPRLIHNDLKPQNIVRVSSDYVLLDWEAAAYGDPLLDLAKLWWRSGIEDVNLFLNIYKSTTFSAVTDSVATFRLKIYRALTAVGYYMSAVDNCPKRHLNNQIRLSAMKEIDSTDWAAIKKLCLDFTKEK